MKDESEEIQQGIKEMIVIELQKSEKSISGLQKALMEQGYSFHRLVLTGYLRAMVDVGILSEKEIKPSRIYSIMENPQKDIYYYLGESVKEFSDEDSGDICLIALSFLFNRPIFMREIEKCGVDLPRNYRKSKSSKREEYLKNLENIGIKIPPTNMLVEPSIKNNDVLFKTLKKLILVSYDISKYSSLDPEYFQRTLEELE
ncbi:MAG: hypothetical protein ACYDAO_02000 [Thermoplasmataceae archaeon]